MPPRGPLWDWVGLDTIASQLTRMEGKLDQLLLGQDTGKELIMAEQEEITNLVQQVQANRDVVQSATTAFNGLVETIDHLSQELRTAIDNSTDVSPEIKQAAEDLQASTDALRSAIPLMAQAVKANTTK